MPRAAAGLPAAPGDRGGRGAGAAVPRVTVIYPMLLTSHHTRSPEESSHSTLGYRGGVNRCTGAAAAGGCPASDDAIARTSRRRWGWWPVVARGGGGGRPMLARRRRMRGFW